MKEQRRIPRGKVERASKFLSTGARVGGNYVKHYAKKAFNPELSRDALDEANANDIYKSLSVLKGSALKVAQMMSMEKNLMPKAYQQQFALSQYAAPPLSYPLVVKIFKNSFGKGPEELYDQFEIKAARAASIGQVHRARLDGEELAVKVQYPGVADSVQSDLKIVKPLATRLFNLSAAEVEHYMEEVEQKLLEETDYQLELRQSMDLSEKCGQVPGIHFPRYYPELSGDKIITMEWLSGLHLKEFLDQHPEQEIRNRAGQALWDFYMHQIHVLNELHADPHPGNFLFEPDGRVGILDFGCVKKLPNDFYTSYFRLLQPELLDDDAQRLQVFLELGFIRPDDSAQDRELLNDLFTSVLHLLSRPFFAESFDFGNKEFFDELYALTEGISQDKRLRQLRQARGPRDALYLNRTYFGLFFILHDLGATITSRVTA